MSTYFVIHSISRVQTFYSHVNTHKNSYCISIITTTFVVLDKSKGRSHNKVKNSLIGPIAVPSANPVVKHGTTGSEAQLQCRFSFLTAILETRLQIR